MGTGSLILIGWLLICLVAGGATVWLVHRVWKQRATASFMARVAFAMVASAAIVGGAGTVMGALMALGATGGESVDPSQKARLLAEGISEAMNCTAFGLVLWIPSLTTALLLLRRRRQ